MHRIGRTGRAGRSGQAILFIAPRERNLLRAIERATRQPIEAMNLPTLDDVNQRRIARFKQRIAQALDQGARAVPRDRRGLCRERGAELLDVAAAIASLAQGRTPLLLGGAPAPSEPAAPRAPLRGESERPGGSAARPGRRGSRFGPQQTYRLEVGRAHGVLPGNLVGAIANEADLDGSQINGIDIQDDHSFVRLPAGMPPQVLERLAQVRVKGRALAASPVERRSASRPGKPKPHRRVAK